MSLYVRELAVAGVASCEGVGGTAYRRAVQEAQNGQRHAGYAKGAAQARRTSFRYRGSNSISPSL